MAFKSRRTHAPHGVAVVAAALALAATMTPAPATASTTSPAESPAASAAPGTAPSPETGSPESLAGRYIVTLSDKPLATYEGGVPGIAATKPVHGRKVDTTTANAKRYRDHLVEEQATVAAAVGAEPVRNYSVATNGFVADLSGVQALKLMRTPGVVSVARDELHQTMDDKNSTDFLGLSGPNGVWSTLGGTANAGKGVVIGDIDTGIWPESRSLAAPALDSAPPSADDPYRPYLQGTTIVMRKADGGTFTGTCQTGEQFAASACNQKLISARYFGDTWLKQNPPAKRADYVSPRDGQGHGTHTATTAAGNADVDVKIGGRDFGKITGVAPGAAIAVYKALWQGKNGGATGGYLSDIVAAIDQAVADGVDAINYSVGTALETPANSAINLAFLNAASAGIFVSASAGNQGPDRSSMDNTMPWETTVAASTIAPYTGTVELGNGARYTGVSTSLAATVGPKPLVLAESVKNATATVSNASLCSPDSLDPAKVAGTIVVCDRGVIARTIKSAEVKRAGGAGMVLVNLTDSSEDGDLHSVPTVHLNTPHSLDVREYAKTASAQATLVPGGGAVPYPQIAGFSSRGPSLTNSGDLLKPDIAAPGVSILAAVAPPTNEGQDFAFESGTSMAAPHIAGLAALYLGEHPDWSPSAVKSAMMTTATDTKTATGDANTDLFAQGAGEVTPTRMLNPGLVYDSSEEEWLGYLEGRGVHTGSGVPAITPTQVNYPSIAFGQLLGSRTITRRVTAVTPGVYHAKIDLPGMKATVRPSTLKFDAAGETKEFTVTLTQKTAESGDTTIGSLTWVGGGVAVRSPIVLTPESALAPAQISGTGKDGSVTFTVTPGLSKFPINAYGMVSGPLTPGSVSNFGNPEQDFWTTVPEDAKAVEFTARTDNPEAGLTVLVAREIDGKLWFEALSDMVTPDARVSLPNPKPGRYFAAVITLGDLPGTTSTPFTFQTNLVNGEDGAGEITVSPKHPKVTPGEPLRVTASWSNLPSDARHTGYVEFPNGSGTVITVN
ncbi:subtilisin family serine protease [Planotetraspora sp. GP83]